MPSPFPGMNPYLEQPSVWEDFHSRFMAYAGEQLATQVRPNFLVKLEERVFIHEPSSDERRRLLGRPDIAILGNSLQPSTATSTATPLATTLPNKVQSVMARIADADMERHAYIEIRDRQSRQLVTMIEGFSPSNKRFGPDRDQYLMKRTAVMLSSASIVEIDLLRGGPRLPLDGLPTCDYCVSVHRKSQWPEVEAWPIALRSELPLIPVPLKGDFPDAQLDLKALLDRVYDAAGYEDYLYESPPEPPLEPADALWAQAFVNQASQ